MRFALIILLALIVCAVCLAAYFGSTTGQESREDGQFELPYKQVGNICEKRLKEPSGIAYHPQRRSLFIVGDEGWLYEMQMDGRLIRSEKLKQSNLEGITVNPLTGLLYAVVEGADTIVEIDPENPRVTRKFKVDRDFGDKTLLKKGGKGLEAIVFIPDASHSEGGTFWVGNQSLDRKGKEPSVICEVSVPIRSSKKKKAKGKITRFLSPDTIDISGLTYDPGTGLLIVISDRNNLLLEVERSGEIRQRYRLPGNDQEGITLDGMGSMYIAQETGEIIKFAQ